MARYTRSQYRLQVMALMAVYVACMLLVWPHVRDTQGLPLKVLLALVPVVPVTAVLGLMAKRVLHSDELEQRVHMIALGIATALVTALTLLGGFLCAAGVLPWSGDILIWVFPALSIAYGFARWLVLRRYAATDCE